MVKLLNDICKVISLSLGIILSNLFLYSQNDVALIILVGIIFGIIIKLTLFSKSYIESRVEFFYEGIQKRLENVQIKKIIPEKKLETQKEKKKIIYSYSTIVNEAGIEKEKTKNNLISKNYKIEKKDSKLSEKSFDETIKKFFGKNFLTKIGAILVFLGVLFLLIIVWDSISEITKIIIGFSFGFGLYGFGMNLLKKGNKNNGEILIGFGLLINFLVILGMKYLTGFQDEIFTIILLVLMSMNTYFSVYTGKLIDSKNIILYGFILSFINPFFIGLHLDYPYLTIIYTIILSLGLIKVSSKQKNNNQIIVGFFMALTSIFFINFNIEIIGILKLLTTFILGGFFIYILEKNNYKKLGNLIVTLGLFIFAIIINIYPNFLIDKNLIISLCGAVILLYTIFSYYYFEKKHKNFLYELPTVLLFLTITILVFQDINIYLKTTILTISLFVTLMFPIFNKKLIQQKEALRSYTIGYVGAAIFALINIFEIFGTNLADGIISLLIFSIGILFIVLLIIFYKKYSGENIKNSEKLGTIFYMQIGIIVTILNISFINYFYNNDIILTLSFISQACAFYYVSSKNNNKFLFLTGTIISIIGLGQLLVYIQNSSTTTYLSILPLSIVVGIIMTNIKNIGEKSVVADGVNIVYIFAILSFISENSISYYGLDYFFHSMLLILLGIFSAKYGSKILKIFFIIILAIIGLVQASDFGSINNFLEKNSSSIIIIFQYLTSVLLFVGAVIFSKINKNLNQKIASYVVLSIYSLIIFSIYIYDITQNFFTITIFWGIIGIISLLIGISKEKIKLRTSGLYILSLVMGKVFLFDIWFSLDNAISRVIIFLVLGILMIFVSLKYSKKYGDDMIGEFNFENFYK